MPDTYIKTMNDKDGNIIAPRTHAQAVQMDDGQYNLQETVESKISNNVGATGANAAAIGTNTTAIGDDGFSAGNASAATGNRATSLNEGTVAQGWAQTAVGRWNIAQGDSNTFVNTDQAFILGNGTSDAARSNALTIDWRGNVAAAGDISSGGLSLPRKNWIINGGFDVWQRGTYFTTNGYTVDRWLVAESNTTTTRVAFTSGQTEVPNNPRYYTSLSRNITKPYGNQVIVQRIEHPYKMSSKTMSISFWAKGTPGKKLIFNMLLMINGIAVRDDSFKDVYLTSSWTKYTQTFTMTNFAEGLTIGDNDWIAVRLLELDNFSTFTFDIANVSLVEGSVPVEWQTEAYADVLRQCLRYYVRFNAVGAWSNFIVGVNISSTAGNCFLPVSGMRDISSVEFYGLAATEPNVVNAPITSVSLAGPTTPTGVVFNYVVSGGLTAWRNVVIGAYNNASAYLAFNAEL